MEIRALLEMKMRCVNPAGFISKWLHVISMHGLEKRQPEAPRFNYVMIWRVLWGVMMAKMSEAGTAGFPGQCSHGDTKL